LKGEDQKFQPKEYLYFLPVVLVFINFLPQFILTSEERNIFNHKVSVNALHLFNIKYLFFSVQTNSILRFLSNSFFFIAAYLILLKNTDKVEFFFKKFILALISLSLLSNIFFLCTSLLLNILHISDYTKITLEITTLRWISSIINLVTCLLVFLFPKVLYAFLNLTKILTGSNISQLINSDFDGGEKVEQSYKLIAEKLELYFESKPYLQPSFNLSDIARDTQIPFKQISLFFQVYHQVNFSQWKNMARINYAKDLLNNGQAKNLTLEAIALSCGYLSRSNFIKEFKKYTGKNPSDYIKDLPNETFNKNLDF
jgi:AraC-like DNA-binding protein